MDYFQFQKFSSIFIHKGCHRNVISVYLLYKKPVPKKVNFLTLTKPAPTLIHSRSHNTYYKD